MNLRINLGCGIYREPGYLNIDKDPAVGADVVRDLARGLPFSDGAASTIRASHVLEHLDPDDLFFVMGECHRVLESGGRLEIFVPLGVTDDVTHRCFFHRDSFNVFCDAASRGHYRQAGLWAPDGTFHVEEKGQKFPTLHLMLIPVKETK